MATVAIWVLSPISARKRDQGGAEHAKPLRHLGFSSSILSGIRVQMAMPMNDSPSTQRSTSGLTAGGDPRAQRTSQAVVDDGGHQDAQDDGQRLLEACGQDEGQQLRLVADFPPGRPRRLIPIETPSARFLQNTTAGACGRRGQSPAHPSTALASGRSP